MSATLVHPPSLASGKLAQAARRKFLRFFPKGFYDQKYMAWERGYKWAAHEDWESSLNRAEYRRLLAAEEFEELAARIVRVESRTHLLFSFEKMALRDSLRTTPAARDFTIGLYDFLYGAGRKESKFERWCEVVAALPRKQSRVLTWPVMTVFGYLALPSQHFYLKPNVTRAAAREYGFDLQYKSRPSWNTYASVLEFAETVRRDLADLKPRDMIDLQSFIWTQGSSEYEE